MKGFRGGFGVPAHLPFLAFRDEVRRNLLLIRCLAPDLSGNRFCRASKRVHPFTPKSPFSHKSGAAGAAAGGTNPVLGGDRPGLESSFRLEAKREWVYQSKPIYTKANQNDPNRPTQTFSVGGLGDR